MKLALPPISCKIYTPPALADAIVCALGDNPRASWLEPSHGTGAFLKAIKLLGVPKGRIVAVDLDRTVSAADNLATTFRGVDFLRWANETEYRFDRIVGNPPFISIKHLPASLQNLAASILDVNGHPIGRGANVWYAFVLASLRLLKRDGCLSFVLPSAAEFANYSAAIRQTVVETFNSLELYRCDRPLFENVQEGTLVAIARGYGAPPCKVSRKYFETPEGLIEGLSRSGTGTGHKCPAGRIQRTASTITLNSVASIRLGGVTGDASYFLMNEERRQSLELPSAALMPVVSKAKHLRSAFMNWKTWCDLRSSDQRVWLFSPSDKVAKYKEVSAYLNLDVDNGGCIREAYKVSIRKPWYRTPMPEQADAFLSGMSQYGPWFCINEMQGLNATNTLYVVTFKNRRQEVWHMWALALLSSLAQRQIRRIGRRYADGLLKYEPGPLGKIELPQLREDVDYRTLYTKAVGALLAADIGMAKDIADSARA